MDTTATIMSASQQRDKYPMVGPRCRVVGLRVNPRRWADKAGQAPAYTCKLTESQGLPPRPPG